MQQQRQNGGKSSERAGRNVLTIYTTGHRRVRDGNAMELLRGELGSTEYFEKILQVRVRKNDIVVEFDENVNCIDVMWHIECAADDDVIELFANTDHNTRSKPGRNTLYLAEVSCPYGRFVKVYFDPQLLSGFSDAVEELKKHGVVLGVVIQPVIMDMNDGTTLITMFARNDSCVLDKEWVKARWNGKVLIRAFDPWGPFIIVEQKVKLEDDKLNVLWERFGRPAFHKAIVAAGLIPKSSLKNDERGGDIVDNNAHHQKQVKSSVAADCEIVKQDGTAEPKATTAATTTPDEEDDPLDCGLFDIEEDIIKPRVKQIQQLRRFFRSWLSNTPVTHAAVADVAVFADYEAALPDIASLIDSLELDDRLSD